MKKGSFLLLLIFGLSMALLSSVPSVKAAGEVSLVSHTGYVDSSGYYYVVGEVENTGDVNVNFVWMTAMFYDSNNSLIGLQDGPAYVKVLLIGRKSPFMIMVRAYGAQIHHYTIVQPINFEVYPEGLPLALEIVQESSYIEPQTGCMHIVGEIRNNGGQTATTVFVYATYYNTTGNVVAVSMDLNPRYIDPGQNATFDIILEADRVPYVASYALTAESDQYAILPEYSSLIRVVLLIGTLALIISFRNKKSLTLINGR